MLPFLGACASSAFEHRDFEEPHAEVHVRMYYHDHFSTELEESFFINGRSVRVPFESKHSSIPTKVALVAPGEPTAVSVGARYDKDISPTEKVAISSLILSRDEAANIMGWELFVNSELPGDQCHAHFSFTPEAGAKYLNEYRYLGERKCGARCRRVLSDINDPNPEKTAECDEASFRHVADLAASAAEDRTLAGLLRDQGLSWRLVASGLEVTTSSVSDLRPGDLITEVSYRDGVGRSRVVREFEDMDQRRLRMGPSRQLVLRLRRDAEDRVVVLD